MGKAGQARSGLTRVRATLDGALVADLDLSAVEAGGFLILRVRVALTAGPHALTVTVDPKDQPGASPVVGRVFELDEQNNEARLAFSVEAPGPAGPSQEAGPVTTSPPSSMALLAIVPVLAGVGAAVFLLPGNGASGPGSERRGGGPRPRAPF